MAVTKIHAIKSTLSKALAYIENPDKTQEQLLVSGYNVDPLMASVEFEMTAAMAMELKGNYTKTGGANNLAYHLIQSFSPDDDVTPAQAHEIGKQLADKFLEGKYEYVISTHVDKGHIHNHIILNAVSFYDHKKLQTKPYKTAAQIRAISDNLCAENNLSVIRKGEKLGYSHTEYIERKKNTSWKSEIRKRLNFILKSATSFEEFQAAAEAMGIQVDDSGKHIKFKIEGQQRWARGKSLADTDTYTSSGITNKLQNNSAAQAHLKASIVSAAEAATTYEDFVHALKNEFGISIVRRKSGQTFYKLNDMDGSRISENILGSAYSISAIRAGYSDGNVPFEDNAPYSIADEFSKTARTKVEEGDTPIRLPSSIIHKLTPEGILLQLPTAQLSGQVFIDNAHIDFNEATGEYTAWFGSKYDYYFVNDSIDPDLPESEQLSSRYVKGEDLIRCIDHLNDTPAHILDIAAEDIQSIGANGVTLSIPDLGISRLFIEQQYVTLDRSSGGSRQIALYDKWNYSFRANQGNELQNITGAALIEKLRQREASPSGQLINRITAYNRRCTLSDAKELANVLRLLRGEQIADRKDIELRISALAEQTEALHSKIQDIDVKNEQYKKAAKYLSAYQRYTPVLEAAEDLRGRKRSSYEVLHEGELTALRHAITQLDKMGVNTNVDPEKVLELVRKQDQEIDRLRDDIKAVSARIEEFRSAQRIVDTVQHNSPSRPEAPQNRKDPERRKEVL